MANRTIDKPSCYARSAGTRVWIAFKTKRSAWRGLALDFQNGTRDFAPFSVVRNKVTGQKWVDGSAVRKRRGPDLSNITAIG
jgi:hypothetical protein